MPNIGPLEIGIVLVIALFVFGPKKLPDLGRSLGSSIREFKGSIGGGDDEEREGRDAGGNGGGVDQSIELAGVLRLGEVDLPDRLRRRTGCDRARRQVAR